MPREDLLSTFDFELPGELIAQAPVGRRDGSRLMRVARYDSSAPVVSHHLFGELPDLLRPGDLLVLNDTKVLTARIDLARSTGGGVRGLLLEAPRGAEFRALLEGKGRLRVGDVLAVKDGGGARLAEDLTGGEWRLICDSPATASRLLESGRMPLPPYIKRAPGQDPRDALDRERYQTTFARESGAVAAPTAGLHLTPELIAALAARGVHVATITLHVGRGTFEPVRSDDLSGHVVHPERYAVPAATATAIAAAKARGGRVIAVGTTVVRTLESAVREGEVEAGAGETTLFVRPPYEFRAVDALITNFHLPKSTLLVLVSAFAGTQRVLSAYREAVERRYRFFSYGDAMLVE